MSPPFRVVEFDIMYGQGISKLGELIDIGVKSGIINKSGAWFSYKGDKIGQGRENSKIFLQENPKIASEIETLIRSKSDDLPEDLMEQEIEDIPEEDEKE